MTPLLGKSGQRKKVGGWKRNKLLLSIGSISICHFKLPSCINCPVQNAVCSSAKAGQCQRKYQTPRRPLSSTPSCCVARSVTWRQGHVTGVVSTRTRESVSWEDGGTARKALRGNFLLPLEANQPFLPFTL